MQRGSFHTDSVRRRGVAGGGSDEAGSSVEHAPMCFFLSSRPHTTLPPIPLVMTIVKLSTALQHTLASQIDVNDSEDDPFILPTRLSFETGRCAPGS